MTSPSFGGAPDRKSTGSDIWASRRCITTAMTGLSYFDKSSPLQIMDADEVSEEDVILGPRVGIAYAEAWAHMPWRFRIKNSKWTSLPKEVQYEN